MRRYPRLMAIIALALPPAGTGGVTATPPAESTEKAIVVPQRDDGSILLSGSDATIRGTTLRWEPEEKKRTLGFWTKASDAAEWRFDVHTPGTFEVEVLQGCGKGQGGSEMGVVLDADRPGAELAFTVEDTGGFQEFRPRTIGRMTIADGGEHVLLVQPKRIAKAAACDIRQIRLVPAARP